MSGSCWQVAAGLHSALSTLTEDSLEKRVYFVEDLLGTTCERLMIDNLPMQELKVEKEHGLQSESGFQRPSDIFRLLKHPSHRSST